jgi:hypothetical protein
MRSKTDPLPSRCCCCCCCCCLLGRFASAMPGGGF